MRRAIMLLALLGATVVVPAIPSSASWVSNHCSDSYFAMANWRPKDARAYVDVALQEGYEYGGGCWNDNNRDDTPDQPRSRRVVHPGTRVVRPGTRVVRSGSAAEQPVEVVVHCGDGFGRGSVAHQDFRALGVRDRPQ